MKTIDLDGDMTTDMFVVPGPASGTSRPPRAEGRTMIDPRPAPRAPVRGPVLAAAGAGAAAQPAQHRAVACICRCSRATSSTARCSGATRPALRPDRRCCSRASPRRLRRSTSSAACATRACRPTSCSTCGWTMYRHLQRLSPRFYARTRLGDIMSRINNDIGEIQRVAAEAALAWVGNVLFLVGTVGDARLARPAAVPADHVHGAVRPLGAACTTAGGSRAGRARCARRSADIGSFLIETLQAHAAGRHFATRRSARSTRFRRRNDAFIDALMSMQMAVVPVGRPAWAASVGGHRHGVRLRRAARDRRRR